jgi:hypothetical protein
MLSWKDLTNSHTKKYFIKKRTDKTDVVIRLSELGKMVETSLELNNIYLA